MPDAETKGRELNFVILASLRALRGYRFSLRVGAKISSGIRYVGSMV